MIGRKTVGELTDSLGSAPSGAMNFRVSMPGHATGDGDGSNIFESQHAAIIGRTLRWADEAAARCDYAEAVQWVETVRSLGEACRGEYEAKRRVWVQLASAAS